MALTNYTTLKTSIADWLNRDDLTSVIPDFIAMAEAQFNRRIRHWRQLKRATAEITGQYTDLPSDWMELHNVQLNASPPYRLQYVSPDEADTYRYDYYGSTTGKPLKFTIIGNTIELVPTPDTTYTVEISYYSRLAALSDTNATNWLLTNYPDIYLYGSLLQAAPYLHDDARVGMWESQFEKYMEDLRLEDWGSKWHGGNINARPKSFGY